MTFYELYQYYKNKGAETGEGIESISNKQVIVPQQYQQGGGDGPQGDFGKFGNLLKDTEKTFNKEVWSDTLGPPGSFEWTPTDIKGYKNATSGLYQTIDGKNINHLGLNVKPIAVSIFEAMFGKKENKIDGFKPGSIKGTFTEGIPQNWKDTISNIGNPFKKNTTPSFDYSTIGDTSVDANENSYVDTSNNNGGGGGNTGDNSFGQGQGSSAPAAQSSSTAAAPQAAPANFDNFDDDIPF